MLPISSDRERNQSLLHTIREQFDPRDIDRVARAFDLVLIRSDGPRGKDDGFALIDYTRRPVFIESVARPGEWLKLWGTAQRITVRSIAINRNAGIPEAEIFWHEFYHLFYSPHGVQQSERFVHEYSTEGALHYREERRANEFAAAVLVPSLAGCETIRDIMEKYGVSERLATIAAQMHAPAIF